MLSRKPVLSLLGAAALVSVSIAWGGRTDGSADVETLTVAPAGDHPAGGEGDVDTDVDAPPPRATSPLASVMIRVGLGPEALAAVGVSSGQVSTLVADLNEAASAAPDALRQADQAYAQARGEADRLRRLIRSRKGGSDAVAQNVALYQTSCSTRDSAESARASVLDTLGLAARDSLTQAQVDDLAVIVGNRHWKQPVAYLLVDRTEEDWVRLRDCLGNERTAPEIGDPLDSECQTWLAQVRSHAKVSVALTRLDSNLAAVDAAWNIALSD